MTGAKTEIQSASRATGNARQATLDQLERFGLIIAWVATIAIFGVIRPETFLTWANFSTILGSQAVLVIATLGLIIPLTAGDYDLSIASVLTLSSMMIAVLNVNQQIPIELAVVAALSMGIVTGFLNGFFIIYFRIHSLIVTLGIGTFLHGITLWICDSMTISGISENLINLVIVNRFLGVPLGFYYALVICVAVWYVFSYTPLGRYMYFVGAGRNVARLSGIPVDWIRAGSFVAGSFLSALAGVLLAGWIGASEPNVGPSYLLPAFAAAFLGASVLQPGRFNPWGTFVAVYFLVTGVTGLELLGLAGWIEQVFYGSSLILAVAVSTYAVSRRLAT